MINSERIDLTEHRDFRERDGGEMDIPTSRYIDEGITTSDQYQTVLRWESIFGKTRHQTEKLRIFLGGRVIHFIKTTEGRCGQCGELLKPWEDNLDGLCKGCRTEFGIKYRIPWKLQSLFAIRDRTKEVFNLR